MSNALSLEVKFNWRLRAACRVIIPALILARRFRSLDEDWWIGRIAAWVVAGSRVYPAPSETRADVFDDTNASEDAQDAGQRPARVSESERA